MAGQGGSRRWLVSRVQIASPVDAVRPASHSALMPEPVLGNGRVSRIPPGADPAVVAGLAAALER